MALDWLTRSIRPPDPEIPNSNDPVAAAPGTVGPPSAVAGDPHGLTVEGADPPWNPLPTIRPSAWSGWPGDPWQTPNWGGRTSTLVDTAWMCVDLNASILASMPPYLVAAASTLDADWLRNPDPDLYTSWEEFAKQLFWDYQLGEAFVMATSWYATGWPARFHVVPPWAVNVEMQGGVRAYSVGQVPIPPREILHLRYQSTVADAHGHGPLEAGAGKVVASQLLARYATTLATSGLIPSSILEAPDEMSPDQAGLLRDQWVQQRMAAPGFPAVLSGGLKWTPTQLNPKDMALLELAQFTDSRVAVMLGVPPFLAGLPSGGDSMTYANVSSIFDYHWRAGLRPKAQTVMAGLSDFLLPRGTSVELNRDAYVQPAPLERAQTAQIYNAIRDDNGVPALTVDEIRQQERFRTSATPTGVLR